MLLAGRAAFGIANRAFEIAVVGDFYQRKARVLLMICAEPAIVRAAPSHRCVELQRHLRGFDENFPAPPVIIHVVGEEHSLMAVYGAAFQHVHAAVLENYFSLDLLATRRADRDRHVVEQVRTDAFTHAAPRKQAGGHAARSTRSRPHTPTG